MAGTEIIARAVGRAKGPAVASACHKLHRAEEPLDLLANRRARCWNMGASGWTGGGNFLGNETPPARPGGLRP
jgi:hypothetical protein